mmetsp:Transcript_85861/g.152061  ORF Transcript_85861/g.152061 Transcript_85861/m.152061 type:complete len:92 (-) Transcript_85861:402-677(-)
MYTLSYLNGEWPPHSKPAAPFEIECASQRTAVWTRCSCFVRAALEADRFGISSLTVPAGREAFLISEEVCEDQDSLRWNFVGVTTLDTHVI